MSERISEVTNEDCVILMQRYPDKYFDLAVVDPPYGIDMSQELYKRGQSCKANGYKAHLNKDWDKNTPNVNYFSELKRISANQIIFGGNYFTEFLKPTKSWVVWNKVQRDFSFADGELAWTSHDSSLKIFDYARGNDSGFAPKLKYPNRTGLNIHPTQKPVALYDWIYKTYLPEGGKVIDTHLGSGSSRIAAHRADNIDFTACEIDKDYFEAQEKRYKTFKSQLVLFAA